MSNSTQATNADYQSHLDRVKRHYEKAIERTGADGVLIASGSPRQTFLDDHAYPFIVNPHFKYWLPITDQEGCFILYRPGQRPCLLFHQPADYWHKPPADPSGDWVEHWDIQVIGAITDAHNHLGNTRGLAFIGEDTAMAEQWGITRINPGPMLDEVHYHRAYKTDYELAQMEQANRIAASGHIAARQGFEAGHSEFEIQQAYLAAIDHREKESPYTSIVALNENAAVLHYQHYKLERPAMHRSMLIDAGANHLGYAADVTRTYCADNSLFAELIAALDLEQQGVIDDIRVGGSYTDLHINMHHRVAKLLKTFDLVNMDPASMVEENVTFNFLPHGLGHLLGLQVHDVGGFQQNPEGETLAAPEAHPALRLTRTLENRQVFTIEPGLYFIPMLLDQLRGSPHAGAVNWERIEALIPYGGIRIEDNVAVLDGKPVNLTREAFAQCS